MVVERTVVDRTVKALHVGALGDGTSLHPDFSQTYTREQMSKNYTHTPSHTHTRMNESQHYSVFWS